MYDLKKARLAANTVRMLSAEAVQKAKSGHPGMPLGCADYAMTLWYKYMRHNPKNPAWIGRDRFVLSAGHGSMLEYSLLHLFEYGLSMDELKNFRQWESKTPDTPSSATPPGVDITSGTARHRVRLGGRAWPSRSAISLRRPGSTRPGSPTTKSTSSPATAA